MSEATTEAYEVLNALAVAVVRSGVTVAVRANLSAMGGGQPYRAALAKLSQVESGPPSLCELMGEHQGPFGRQQVYNAAGGHWAGHGDCATCGSSVSVPEHMRERMAA